MFLTQAELISPNLPHYNARWLGHMDLLSEPGL